MIWDDQIGILPGTGDIKLINVFEDIINKINELEILSINCDQLLLEEIFV
jgi:hypothetical protein